ncbi:MAG TPA: lysophospholipid acyltransferase family protein, partial [Thermohalobaculum sp.]|nr:lysophospholipid acyltransferase family protein [Thermohalobaculum sp.]
WYGADPPALGPPSLREKARGIARLAAFLGMTAVLVPLFLVGRAVHSGLGSRPAFHFSIATLWSRATLRLCGLRARVHGRPVDSGALVANHSSWLDIPALRRNGLIYFVSKKDVQRWPAIGFVAHVCGTVFIERRRTEAKRQERMLRQRIEAEERLCFFPEATSTDGQRVLPFKSSLFSAFFEAEGQGADLSVQPVTVRYRVAPGSGLPAAFYGWWGAMPFGPHVWQVFCRSHGGIVEITFHDPVRPRDFPDRKALADQTHRTVAGDLPHR